MPAPSSRLTSACVHVGLAGRGHRQSSRPPRWQTVAPKPPVDRDMRSPTPSSPGRARRGSNRLAWRGHPRWPSGEGFGLQPLKLRLVDRARVQQLLGPGDLLGGRRLSSGGDVAHVAFKLLLGPLLLGRGPLTYPLAPNDQVDEYGQE